MNDVRIDLSPIVREINALSNNLGRQIDLVGTEVGQVRNDVKLTGDELRTLRRDFEAFVAQAARTAAVQQSQTKVGNLKAQLDREFGHYATVRRTSVGTLQAFDVGVVSNDVVASVSEELMLQTPRYWLSPALVGIAAWSRDNKEISERAVREAFARDKNKASLFFALVLRRQGRTATSVRWLKHYFAALDPTALTREFAVILEATSYDAFGAAGQHMLSETMSKWCAELRSRADVVEAQINNWMAEIAVQRQRLDGSQYAALSALSPTWSKLQAQLESASALPEVVEKYQGIRDFDAPIPAVLEDLLDDILDQLVTEYDEEELPLKRDVVYHEAIIEENGDLDRARLRADELQRALEETNDVVTLQTMAAINPAQLGVGAQTQRIAIGVGSQDFHTAVGRFTAEYRAAAIDQLELKFGSDHSTFAGSYSFTGCTVSTADPEERGIATITAAWESTFAAYIERISFKNKWYLVPSLIAAGVVLVAFLINPIVGVVGLLIGGGVVYGVGENQKKKCAAEVANSQQTKASAIQTSIQLYRDATAQLVDALLTYQELDEQESELLTLISTWPTAGFLNKEVLV